MSIVTIQGGETYVLVFLVISSVFIEYNVFEMVLLYGTK